MPGPYVFTTRSGELRAGVGPDGLVLLDLPSQPTAPLDPGIAGRVADHLGAALGVQPEEVESNGIDVVVRLAVEDHVRTLSPDIAALSLVDARCVVVTAAATRRPVAEDVVLEEGDVPDAVSRVFCPRVGIAEDPVTGSAHCALGPFWARRLGCALLLFRQVSCRGGARRVRVLWESVELAGRAVTVLDGNLAAGPPPVDEGR